MTATAAELQVSVAAAISAAAAIGVAAEAGEYSSVLELEAAVGAARTTIDGLLADISTVWGVEANPLLVALRELAARLLDLRELVDDAGATVEETLDRESSFVELAILRYGDWERWTELADLNRQVATPARIPAGTTLVRYAQ